VPIINDPAWNEWNQMDWDAFNYLGNDREQKNDRVVRVGMGDSDISLILYSGLDA